MKFEKEWILECLLMRMKSPRLYEHMRINKILTLPGRTCLQKSFSSFKAGFGFNERMLTILKEKFKYMDIFHRHGNLLFDELKLSENLQLKSNGIIEEYVDYGANTPTELKNSLCDHGMVLLFQPFVGDWVQVIGVFATHSNMIASDLANVLIEAIIYVEDAGLFVDVITGDAASWNRAMWKQFGIGQQKNGNIRCSVIHPCDETRHLYFVSDFPHLLKCLRNGLLRTGFKTPDGDVRIEHIRSAWKEDENPLKMRAMPKISKVHLYPNNFEKMRVSYAFQLFSDEVLRGLYLYKNVLISQYNNIECTVEFIKKIGTLIKVMTSRYGMKNGLQVKSKEFKFLQDFLSYLSKWETFCGKEGLGYLSKSTSVGFKVTLNSALSLTEYLSKEVGLKYLLTSRLSQDKLENFFGIIRQSKGCNDHPTASEFLMIVECLSFYNLARPPRGSNALPSVVSQLISPPQQDKQNGNLCAQSIIDELIDNGKLFDASAILNCSVGNKDHKSVVMQHSDSRLIFYVAGYVVRKFLREVKCNDCKKCLASDKEHQTDKSALYTKEFDRGGLIYPSNTLFNLICKIENVFTECFSINKLHQQSLSDVIYALEGKIITAVGCVLHSILLTKQIIKFFVITRMHFYLKQLNKNRCSRRQKANYLKMRRCK